MLLKSCFHTWCYFLMCLSSLWNKTNNMQRTQQGSATEALQQGSPRLLVMAWLNEAVIRNSFFLLGGPAWGFIGVVTEVLVTLSDILKYTCCWSSNTSSVSRTRASNGLFSSNLWVLVTWQCALSGSSRESHMCREGLLLDLWASRNLVAFDKFFI